ncbi:PPOX class F420-dependent oxidoreductase [Dermatobacter hominis]|uniref:PPOX class F420-dependent oxidoreductase n=1 Tax=Dermatobacter hominis TaxID=2884263 RepID=UPI001D11E72A|nr:PPOX class F420-dependent oxidoreductase [Dermatobacter hominis]UDY37806.1 PPOX class F420-dependent oxidoreductase [Dermatobacter hominis]
MGYNPMTDEQIRALLLAEPARPAVLATRRPDGRPHAAPIWYDLDGGGEVGGRGAGDGIGEIVFNTGERTVKGRNLAADPRLSLVVQDDRAPYAFVAIDGEATLVDDLDQVRLWAGRIGGRYMGADRAEEYGDRNGVPGELLVRVRILHTVAMVDVAD